GTAIAIPIPTTTTARARTSHRRVRARRSIRARTAAERSGAGGKSSSRPSATRACSSSAIRLPKSLERTRRARLDRALGDPERLRDLVLAQAGEKAQRDDQTLIEDEVARSEEHTSELQS